MRHGLFLPPFGEMADPHVLIDVARRTEARGFDGIFLWDHILRHESGADAVADTTVALAAIAMATTRLRFGPMVTPPARRRPHKLAREAVSLDHLSNGRLILGLGLGVDSAGELSAFGETLEPRQRGADLDEAAYLLCALWSGETVEHDGPSFPARSVRFLPRPLQQPRIPLWFASRGGAPRPTRRAARYDGLFAIEVGLEEGLDGLGRVIELVDRERGHHDGFDIAVNAVDDLDLDALETMGVTWVMWSFAPDDPLEVVLERIDAGVA